jgi:hypothetical protein
LEAAYERGRADALSLAKERLDSYKEMASDKFNLLLSELEQERQGRDADREKARDLITRLREELRAAQSERDELQSRVESLQVEKDALFDKSKLYIQQAREKMEEAQHDVVSMALEKVYAEIGQTCQKKEFYDGDQVVALVKNVLKTVSLSNTNK